MSAHDDHLDPDLHLWPAEPPEWIDTAEANRDEIFAGYSAASWGDLYLNLYKYSECGMTVGVQPEGGDANKRVYGNALLDLHKDTPVSAIYLSSIIEGVERMTDTQTVDLKSPDALTRFKAAEEAVEEEAKSIWNETHGCPGCARKLKVPYECGGTPVATGCRKCGGNGECI